MSDIVIKAENLGKSYVIGHEQKEQYTTLRDVFANKARQIICKTKQLFKGGQLIAGNELEEFWALSDLNFEIKQGDRVGIIGRNGAGKSTLLKILSRITEPTKGKIAIKGRVASLLEVGTGFHPELSGRENIFLNGAVLGMNRTEIKQKFDEIVAFSGVEKFLDTPVKRYSSGMQVRLGFSVAAHLEPDILVVDEILAVGDAEFQKKSIAKMQEVSQGQGRTVLFVSHNMGSIKALCDNGILLKNGKIEYSGNINETISLYLQSDNQEGISLLERTDRYGNKKLLFKSIDFLDESGKNVDTIMTGEFLKIRLRFQLDPQIDFSHMVIGINIRDEYQNNIITFISDEMNTNFSCNTDNSCCLEIPQLLLRGGSYNIRLFASYQNTHPENICDSIENATVLNVLSSDFWNSGKPIRPDKSALFYAKYTN